MNSAVKDHDYLDAPYTKYQIERAVTVTSETAKSIETRTRDQSSSKAWFDERKYRITASRFGEVIALIF